MLAVLAIMSVGSWYIMIVRVWDTHKLGNEAKEVRTAFFKKASLSDGLRGLKEESAFRYIAATAIEASEHHEGALTENIDHSSWVTMNAERAVAGSQRASWVRAWASWRPSVPPAPSSA